MDNKYCYLLMRFPFIRHMTFTITEIEFMLPEVIYAMVSGSMLSYNELVRQQTLIYGGSDALIVYQMYYEQMFKDISHYVSLSGNLPDIIVLLKTHSIEDVEIMPGNDLIIKFRKGSLSY